MISPESAQRLVLKNSRHLRVESVPLKEAAGSVLAENVTSPVDLPHWNNSAMDGYAVRSSDVRGAGSRPVALKIAGTVVAGDGKRRSLGKNEALRIMTGAPIPEKADAILVIERAVVENGELIVREPLEKGAHIRRKGEEIEKGQRLLFKGKALTGGLAGFLASLGRQKVRVYAKPAVAVVSTGSELVPAGRKLLAGKIYDSNSVMLETSLVEQGILPCSVRRVGDDPERLRKVLSEALRGAEIVLVTGGVSAGDYDLCKTILRDLGVRPVFWKVRQKPGKPLYFGRRGDRLVFGLPGNPASVHLCFHEYVVPCLRSRMGFAEPFPPRETGKASRRIRRDRSKTLFLKARFRKRGPDGVVDVLPSQGSHMLSSLGECGGFAVIEPGEMPVEKGARVRFDRIQGALS